MPSLHVLIKITGVPCLEETASPQDSTVGLCLKPYGVPRGGAVSYERGTPVTCHANAPRGVAKSQFPSRVSGMPKVKPSLTFGIPGFQNFSLQQSGVVATMYRGTSLIRKLLFSRTIR